MKRFILSSCIMVIPLFASHESDALAASGISYERRHDFDITNGGMSYGYQPTLFYPKSTNEVQQIIQLACRFEKKVRAIGSLHSLNGCGICQDYVISLEHMNRFLNFEDGYVTVEAGIIIQDLCKNLEEYGYTLEVLGSIAEQTIAGAISTGTRGQVPYAGSLGSYVVGMEIVDGCGNVHNLKRDSDELLCSVTSLGMMGVITKLTLQCKPLFLMAEVIRRMSMDEVLNQLQSMIAYDKLVMYWNIDAEEVKVVSGHRLNCDFSPIGICNFQILGNYPHMHTMEEFPDTLQRLGKSWEINTLLSWNDEKSKRRVAAMKREGKGIFQSDYSIPIEQLPKAIELARKFFRENRHRLHLAKDRMVVEIRPVKSDNVWFSPSYGRNVISLCFHDFERPLEWTVDDASEFLEWEAIMKEHFDVRPHLGKCHFFSSEELQKAFPKWSEFKERRSRADPQGIFLTDYLKALL